MIYCFDVFLNFWFAIKRSLKFVLSIQNVAFSRITDRYFKNSVVPVSVYCCKVKIMYTKISSAQFGNSDRTFSPLFTYNLLVNLKRAMRFICACVFAHCAIVIRNLLPLSSRKIVPLRLNCGNIDYKLFLCAWREF